MNKQSQEQILREIRDQLLQEPALSDPSKIVVNVDRRGSLFNKQTVVTIEGKVKNSVEAKKAAQVVESKLGASGTVDNLLHVNNE